MPAAAEHARFLGIELNGSQEQFKRQLLRVGNITCIEDQCDEQGYVYRGSYAGYSDCEIYVNEKCGNVYCVSVYLPKATSWRQIKRQYNQICGEYNSNSALERIRNEASFEAPYAEGDGDEMTAVAQEKCNFISIYKNETSIIIVKISKYRQVKIIVSDIANFNVPDCDDSEPQPQHQTTSGYMTFMGLPITGTPTQFANRLINEKGFTFDERTDNGSVLVRGRFSGIDNCVVGVLPDNDGSGINIGVLVPKPSTWSTLKAQYFEFKEQLKRKYTLESCEESFSDGYYDGCGNEFEAVRNEKCDYQTKFRTDKGVVAVSISSSCRICIVYIPD